MNMVNILFWTIILMAAWQSADASESQTSDNCYREGVLDRPCLSDRLKRTETEVAGYYQNLRNSFEMISQHVQDDAAEPEDPVGNEWLTQRLNLLVKSQTQWLDYRETVCQAYANEYQHGSLAWPVKMTCLIELNEARLRQLQKIYSPETNKPDPKVIGSTTQHDQ